MILAILVVKTGTQLWVLFIFKGGDPFRKKVYKMQSPPTPGPPTTRVDGKIKDCAK